MERLARLEIDRAVLDLHDHVVGELAVERLELAIGLPYPVFALAGLLGWTYFSQCISRGSEVLVSNTSLITKVYFPRLVAPVASLLPPLVDLGVGLVLLLVACLVYGVAPGVGLLLLPVWALFLLLFLLFDLCFEFGIVSVFPLASGLGAGARGTVLALTVAASGLGRIVGSLVGPRLFEGAGFLANGLLAAGLAATGVALGWALVREGRQ